MFSDDFEYPVTPTNFLAAGWDSYIGGPGEAFDHTPPHTGLNSYGTQALGLSLLTKAMDIRPGFRAESWIKFIALPPMPIGVDDIIMVLRKDPMNVLSAVGYRQTMGMFWAYLGSDGIWHASTHPIVADDWVGFRLIVDGGGVKAYINLGAGWLPFPAAGGYLTTEVNAIELWLYQQWNVRGAFDSVLAYNPSIALKSSKLRNSKIKGA